MATPASYQIEATFLRIKLHGHMALVKFGGVRPIVVKILAPILGTTPGCFQSLCGNVDCPSLPEEKEVTEDIWT